MQRSKVLLILWISLIIIAWGKNDSYSQVNVKIPDVRAKQDSVVFVPVLVSDLSDYGIISYQFQVYFDFLVIQAVGVSAENTLTTQWGNAIANIDTSGKMIVGAFGVSALPAGDTLINLVFKVIAQPGDSTAIMLENFKFNNDNPKALIENGSLKVTLPTGIRDRHLSVKPEKMLLLKNYPDPFHDQTRIFIKLNQPGPIGIEIFNILGQRIKQFESLQFKVRSFSVEWNGTDNRGISVPPGVYFCVVKQRNKIVAVDCIILLK